MPDSNTLLIERLQCIRGERTLFDKLDAHVESGQCLHIIGANGSGKTSLLRIISGLNTADQGHVLWNKTPTNRHKDFLNDSAFIGHKDALKNELSAIENLRFEQKLNSSSQSTNTDSEEQLDNCLSQMQILRCADLLAQQLSFGQRRRLTFAKLLLRPYKIWILDEPFTGIDVQGRKIIETLCMTHLENDGSIVLTHHQSLQNSVFKNHLTGLQLDQYSPERINSPELTNSPEPMNSPEHPNNNSPENTEEV